MTYIQLLDLISKCSGFVVEGKSQEAMATLHDMAQIIYDDLDGEFAEHESQEDLVVVSESAGDVFDANKPQKCEHGFNDPRFCISCPLDAATPI